MRASGMLVKAVVVASGRWCCARQALRCAGRRHEDLRRLFARFDSDGNGSLDPGEFGRSSVLCVLGASGERERERERGCVCACFAILIKKTFTFFTTVDCTAIYFRIFCVKLLMY